MNFTEIFSVRQETSIYNFEQNKLQFMSKHSKHMIYYHHNNLTIL